MELFKSWWKADNVPIDISTSFSLLSQKHIYKPIASRLAKNSSNANIFHSGKKINTKNSLKSSQIQTEIK